MSAIPSLTTTRGGGAVADPAGRADPAEDARGGGVGETALAVGGGGTADDGSSSGSAPSARA